MAGVSVTVTSSNPFDLGNGGLSVWKSVQAAAAAKKNDGLLKSNILGYLDYDSNSASYLDSLVNNISDVFKEGNLTVNSKYMATAVLDYYAKLWNADSYSGFFLTADSAKLHGLWNGRDYLSGKKMLVDDMLVSRHGGATVNVRSLAYSKRIVPEQSTNAYTPLAFYSEDSHYSMTKSTAMLGLRTFYAEGEEKYPGECPITSGGVWPAEVPSDASGAIDIDSLATLVEFFASKGYPIFVCFNYGTSSKGAYDDVDSACVKLKPILEKYGLLEREVKYEDNGETKVEIRTGYWFHVDGAVGAAKNMPYIEMAYNEGKTSKKGPSFDFRQPMVHSIGIDEYKEMMGGSIPCGIYMTRTKYQMLPPDTPDYIGTPDTAVAGSRNGLAAMLVWDNIARHSYEDQIQKALHLEELAAYIESRFRVLQDEVLQTDLYVERAPFSLTVYIKRVNDDLCKKYSLSNEELYGRRYSKVFVMEHVTKELVDACIEDFSKQDAFYSLG